MKKFKNGTGNVGDEWLRDGIPLLLHRYLSTEKTWNLYFQDQIDYLKTFPKDFYRVEGMFQHHDQALRIFVQLKDATGKLVTQIPIKTPYLRHTHFFQALREAAETLLKQVGAKKTEEAALKIIQSEARDIFAFSNYVKGRQALETFDPNHIEVANIWFQESYREDPKYPLPYLGLIDATAFLYLHSKQSDKPHQHFLENIHNTEKAMRKKQVRNYFDGLNEKERKKKGKHPTVQNHIHYTAGKRAYDKGNFRLAVHELRKAFDALPEESLSPYYLGLSYAKIGDTKNSETFLNYAKEINRCLSN